MGNFNKVFGIGMSKTGTTTLGRCFEILGLVPHIGFDRTLKHVFKQQGDPKVILKAAEKYRSFEDSPWYLMFKELDQRFPGSKFILTVRSDSHTHAASSWAHGVARGLRRGAPTEDYMVAKSREYEAHNEAVLEHFNDRADDLLVICWEDDDGWERLCEFLGADNPDVPVPHANTGSYHKTGWVRTIRDSTAYMMLLRGRHLLSRSRTKLNAMLR